MSEESVEPKLSSSSTIPREENSTPAPKLVNKYYDFLQARIETARKWLRFRLPNVCWFQSPDSISFHKERDQRDNIGTRLTEGEEVRVCSLWGVELYGPTEINGLYASLRHLGWDKTSDGNLTEWIATQRMYGSDSHLNLGPIGRIEGKADFFVERYAQMPAEVDCMHGYVYQVSPSLTAIVLCFVFRENSTHLFEHILNKSYQTFFQRFKHRNRRPSVYHLKERAVKEERKRLHRLVSGWYCKNIPGFFSSRDHGARLPVTELLTSRQAKTLNSAADKADSPRWAQIVGKSGFIDVWRLEASEAISLVWNTSDDIGQFHTIISCRTDLLSKELVQLHQKKNASSYACIVNQQVEGVLVQFGVLAGLLEIQRELRLVRDTFPSSSQSSQQALRAIQRIKAFFGDSVGWPTIISDMVSRSQEKDYFRFYCKNFVSEPWRSGDKPLNMTEELPRRIYSIACRTLSQEKEIRDHFEQLSTILNTQESIRTQRRMELLTIVATILTAVSLLATLLSIDPVKEYTNPKISRIIKCTTDSESKNMTISNVIKCVFKQA